MGKPSETSAPTPFERELAAFFGEGGVRAPLRDHVSFRAVDAAAAQPMDAVDDLVRHVRALPRERADRVKLRPHQSSSGAVTVRVYREANRFHTIKVAAADGRLYARHNVADGRALTLMLHDWLTASDRFGDICWRTRDEFAAGEPGHALPE